MERVLARLHAGDPATEVKPTPAGPQRRKKAEISREQGNIKKPPQSASWARRREPLGQPLRNVTPLCLGYPIFFPNDPDAPALGWKHLSKYIDHRKENKENPDNNEGALSRRPVLATEVEKNIVQPLLDPTMKRHAPWGTRSPLKTHLVRRSSERLIAQVSCLS